LERIQRIEEEVRRLLEWGSPKRTSRFGLLPFEVEVWPGARIYLDRDIPLDPDAWCSLTLRLGAWKVFGRSKTIQHEVETPYVFTVLPFKAGKAGELETILNLTQEIEALIAAFEVHSL